MESFEQRVVEKLLQKNKKLSTAESCTGGLLSAAIVSVSGASGVFDTGVCTYSNQSKIALLGVNENTLSQHGAVSSQTAAEMALGAVKFAKSDFSLSVTGIAGPLGGTGEKPVGTVYIGCFAYGKITVKHFIFKGNRDEIREETKRQALILLLNLI